MTFPRSVEPRISLLCVGVLCLMTGCGSHEEVPQPVAVLQGNSNHLFKVTFSRDGNWLIGTYGNGPIVIWDARTYEHLGTLLGHKAGVIALAISNDGKLLASGDGFGEVAVWDLTARREKARWTACEGHAPRVTSVAFHPEGASLFTAGTDGLVRRWDLKSLQAEVVYKNQNLFDQPVICALSPNGETLAIAKGGKARNVLLLSMKDRQEVMHLDLGHGSHRILFAPDGSQLVIIMNGRACLMSLDGQYRWVANTREMLTSYAYSPCGKYVAASGAEHVRSDAVVYIWDAATGQELCRFVSHPGASASGLAFSHDSRLLATGSRDGSVRLWELDSLLKLKSKE